MEGEPGGAQLFSFGQTCQLRLPFVFFFFLLVSSFVQDRSRRSMMGHAVKDSHKKKKNSSKGWQNIKALSLQTRITILWQISDFTRPNPHQEGKKKRENEKASETPSWRRGKTPKVGCPAVLQGANGVPKRERGKRPLWHLSRGAVSVVVQTLNT